MPKHTKLKNMEVTTIIQSERAETTAEYLATEQWKKPTSGLREHISELRVAPISQSVNIDRITIPELDMVIKK